MSTTLSTHDFTWLYWPAGIAVAMAMILLLVIVQKGRLLPGDHVFRASRWSSGNHLLPPQVVISRESVMLYQPQWIGKLEESIHMSHIASVKIDTNLLFSDLFIETSGGRNPIVCHGHGKGDAVEMKRLIAEFQSGYYRKDERPQIPMA